MTTHQRSESSETPDSPSGVLTALSVEHNTAHQAEVNQLILAVQWATMHPVESIDHDAATVPGTQGQLAIAGPGAPLVAEFCIAELALVLGLSTDAGRTYLGDALEIRYRLPHLWDAVTNSEGRVPVWKARRIAQATKHLCPQATAWVDRHLAPVAHRCTYPQLDRTIEDALTRFDPTQAEQRRRQAAEDRHFDIDLDHPTDGTVRVDAILDLADGHDLNTAITTGAKALADLGSDESLHIRRSQAAGLLARGQHTLNLTTDPDTGTATATDTATDTDTNSDTAASAGTGTAAPVRQRDLTIYVHLRDHQSADIENTRSTISVEQVKDWCTHPHTRITVRPVIDLNDQLSTDSYRPTPVMREQAILTNPVCVFPRCNRPSRHLDLDHLENWDHTNTTTHNLAPLCRRHHRYKTHADWTYVRTTPTTFGWTTPHGHQYDTRQTG
jgi:hypothetical protein